MRSEPVAEPLVPGVSRALLCSVFLLSIAGLVSWLTVDQQVISLVADHQIDWDADFWVDAFTYLGKAWLLIWLLMLWSLISGRRKVVLTGLLAMVLVAIAVNPLKVAVGRTRPYALLKAQATGQPDQNFTHHLSFPSGDTAVAFGMATAVLPTVVWPVRLVLLGSCAAIGVLRVAAMAHYPSDVLVGAALGLLAGGLAVKLVDGSGRSEHPVPFEKWLLAGGVVGIPLARWVSDGPAEMLWLLRTYGLLVMCIALPAIVVRAVRSGRLDGFLRWLSRTRFVALALAFVVVIVENVLDGEKPRELLPLDSPVSAVAVIGYSLVFAGAILRLWAFRQGIPRRTAEAGAIAVLSRALYAGVLLVVIGLLLQLNDWVNWLVVLPIFALFYGVSFFRRAAIQEGDLEERRFSRADTLSATSSLRLRLSLGSLRRWARSAFTWPLVVGQTVVLVCLPIVIELLIEDFLFERVLGL